MGVGVENCINMLKRIKKTKGNISCHCIFNQGPRWCFFNFYNKNLSETALNPDSDSY